MGKEEYVRHTEILVENIVEGITKTVTEGIHHNHHRTFTEYSIHELSVIFNHSSFIIHHSSFIIHHCQTYSLARTHTKGLFSIPFTQNKLSIK